jgi:hypothetical protein
VLSPGIVTERTFKTKSKLRHDEIISFSGKTESLHKKNIPTETDLGTLSMTPGE